jgi:magnesium transporter
MGKLIAAAAYEAGRKVRDIPLEESGGWVARPGHFVWIGIWPAPTRWSGVNVSA